MTRGTRPQQWAVFPMSKQYNKVLKRKRRHAYLKRKRVAAKKK